MTRCALVVCTANVCRSPSAALLLERRLDGMVDIDGHPWQVRSAGVADVRAEIDARTVAALAPYGADLAGHRPRRLDARILSVDGADLVLPMTREHLRSVIGIDPSVWGRAFTLRELVRRAAIVDVDTIGTFAEWLATVAQGRRAAEMIRPDLIDDIDDPYGRPRRYHDEMVTEVASLVDRLAKLGPWRPASACGGARG